jgi:hypothetical protein
MFRLFALPLMAPVLELPTSEYQLNCTSHSQGRVRVRVPTRVQLPSITGAHIQREPTISSSASRNDVNMFSCLPF